MMDRENLHLFREEPIDDSVTLHDDLANIVSANLRHDATRLGKLRQTVRCSENTVRE